MAINPDPISRRRLLSNFGLAAAAGTLLASPIPAPAEPAASRKTINPSAMLNVEDFGAAGNGTTDDTEAFASALKAAVESESMAVFVPRGHYLINGRLNVPANVMLFGVFSGAPSARTKDEGSVLLATFGAGEAAGEPFITLHTSSTLRGITVFYPGQKMQNPPVPYPWTIRGQGDNISLIDVLLVNPYQAVDFGTTAAGRHFISGLYGQPLYRGLFIDQCYDVGRVQNVHFWSFWGGWDGELYTFMRENAVAFILGRSDWEFLSGCFCIGYRIGYHFIENHSGPGNYVITESGSDLGPNAVRVEASQAHAGHTFVNCQFMAGVEVAKTNQGPLKFTACGFWGIPTTNHHVLLEGNGHTFLNSCHFITWGQRDPQAAAIHAVNGGLTVTACDFMDAGKPQVTLEPGVTVALIYGNRLRGEQKIEDHTGGHAQIALNGVTAK